MARRAKLLRLAAQGINARQASGIINVPYATVLSEYADPEFKVQLHALMEQAFSDVDGKFGAFNLTLHDRIRLKSEEAFQTLCELMDDDTNHPAIRARIAQDMLDRNPESQAGSVIRHERIEADQLALAARAAEEMNNVLPFRADHAKRRPTPADMNVPEELPPAPEQVAG